MKSADKTTIKAKVIHVYYTMVLANDIQILHFISYRDSDIWRQQQAFRFAQQWLMYQLWLFPE